MHPSAVWSVNQMFRRAGGGGGGANWPYLREFSNDETGSLPSDISMYTASSDAAVIPFMEAAIPWSPYHTKCLKVKLDTQSDGYGPVIDLPGAITFDEDWNIEACFLKTTTIERGSTTMLLRQDSTNQIWHQHSTYEGLNRLKNRVNGVDDATYLQSTGIQSSSFLNHWIKQRVELRVSGNSKSYFLQADGDTPIASASVSGEFPWESVMRELSLNKLIWVHGCSVSSGNYVYVARLYVGKAADGWPSDS